MAAVGSLLMNSYASVVRWYASWARGDHSPLFVSRKACVWKRSSNRPHAHSYGARQVATDGFAQVINDVFVRRAARQPTKAGM
ncbi:hypothetical protein ZHAS_00006279 [Anopheles sinensis]|uniref:Uncharacterized protein n=1 Tax=Anopheles sinensis TaxID=74873 RepID=A0A084VLF5_ANOSI|nr:hypothetical protein ZHAS_00006279 [Anopheles sinensis]